MIDSDKDYFTYNDEGKYVHVLPAKECLQSLEQRIIDQEGLLRTQKKMISEMDQNQCVDAKIEELQKQVNTLQHRLSGSFEISDLNWNKIHKLQKEHDKKHGKYPTAGERYYYEFMPTGIVTCGTCRCGLCKERIDFYED